jgi:hypothetical protein
MVILIGCSDISTPDGTPLSNLYMSMLDKLDIPVETFGDATGTIQGLSGV